ncbi:hypothetical protein LZC95_46195 [Pendulispora brunnea]|uniref:RNase III domain-containing protein n=1 Tax=Pendulispora brunnea TaxID=2905690 RepID=A0ABZ2KAE5_9BACT
MTTDPNTSLARFCLTLEEFRRTPDGRVRGEREFVAHFFAHDAKEATDLVFRHLPREVRGPILSNWKIRGQKTALRDDDAKVKEAVHDALVSGDIDPQTFEIGINAETLVRWVPLSDWWSFWRGGNLSERAILKALSTAYELGLFDAAWFLSALEAPAAVQDPGRATPLNGIEVLSEGLSKADLTEWVRAIHQSADGSPRGLVATLGWEKIVHFTKAPILIAVLDALATKTELTKTSLLSGAASVEPVAPASDQDGPRDEIDAVFLN